ncbi:MAG: triose-phosphate isomerase [Armatimonadetes bacterium]|nr:triose-phosphate isomerase [Armatimonadota bacterium]
MRIPFIAGNWKMHKTVREAVETATALKTVVAAVEIVDIVLCPPFTALGDVGRAIAGSNLELGAQDMHWEPQGAYTGEISGPMLWELGCTYVILGHSERRHHFHETDDEVARKVQAAFAQELLPILCVGETLEERDAGRTEDVIERQVRAAVAELDAVALPRLVVAYEPVWAIGTGRSATGGEANRVSALIRQWLGQAVGGPSADETRVLYGGSVTPENIAEFIGQPEIDGALVGGASLNSEAFAAIVLAAAGGP